jgi:excisionase family DNA binding protein
MVQILRPREAAKRLGVGHTRFYELVNEGRLRLVRLGERSVGVTETELARFVAALPDARPASSSD